MKKFIFQNLWWLALIIALSMLLVHMFSLDVVKIDNTSIILLMIVLLCPFISAIKKIKIGDFEAEIDPKEVEKIKEEISNKLPEPRADDKSTPEIIDIINSIKSLVITDPVIALAKLRIEIEKVLNKIARLSSKGVKQDKNVSIGKMVHDLTTTEVLPPGISGPIREVISICNRAVHGEDIRDSDAKSIIEVGTSLLERLYWHAQEYINEPISTDTINRDELDEYLHAKYQVITIVPYVENPVRNVRLLDQEGLNEFMDGYNEYAEFIVEVKKV